MKINGKKVLKAKGGADASKADFKTPSSSPLSAGYSGAKSAVSTGKVSSPGGGGNGGNQKTTLGKTVKNVATNVGKTTGQLSILPITPFGAVVTGMKAIENARRAKRAKGEFYTSNKKIDPINREFYRTEGRPLDTRIGSLDEPYMKKAGIIGFPKPKFEDNAGPKVQLCPDGTYPPCKSPVTQITQPTNKKSFLSGFKAYDEGGEVIISSNVDKDLL